MVELYPSHLGFSFLECAIRAPGQGIATSHSQDYGEGGTDRFHGRTRKCALGRQVEQDSAACWDNAAMGREGYAPEHKTQV